MNNSRNYTDQGWVSSPEGRGTIDIIWSCILTIFLCVWTSACGNVPAAKDTRWDKFRDKVNLACLGVLGPDFMIILAGGQWDSARRSVHKFHAAGYTDWTLTHAFFADMGGFMLQTPDELAFPLNGEQLLYLIKEGYLSCPQIDKSDIDDKNKSDGLARLIAVIQVLTFTVTSIARAVQHLALTTLELTTLGFAFAMLVTSFFWRAKPQDASTPIILTTATTITQIRRNAGQSGTYSWELTPLDFVCRENWIVSMLWTYYTGLLRRLHVNLFAQKIRHRPIDRIRNDNFPSPSNKVELLLGAFMIAYSSIFVAGWNFTFPSSTERLLWIIASLATFAFATVAGPYFLWCNHAYFRKSSYMSDQVDDSVKPLTRNFELTNMIAETTRRIAPSGFQRPNVVIAWRHLVPCSAACAIYCIARVYILAEDILGLRSLPPSAFDTVNWSLALPMLQ